MKYKRNVKAVGTSKPNGPQVVGTYHLSKLALETHPKKHSKELSSHLPELKPSLNASLNAPLIKGAFKGAFKGGKFLHQNRAPGARFWCKFFLL